MAAPEGYELLARIGFVDRGNYSASTTYLAGDVVYYDGSSWTALKDNLRGVTPESGENWRYMARGFAAELLEDVRATDTSGLIGTAGEQVGAQTLMDKVAEIVATKVMMKSDLVSQIVNDATKAASMAALYSVNEELKKTNSNLTTASPVAFNINGAGVSESSFSCMRLGRICFISGLIKPKMAGTQLALCSTSVRPVDSVFFHITAFERVTGWGTFSTDGTLLCNIETTMIGENCIINFAYITAE